MKKIFIFLVAMSISYASYGTSVRRHTLPFTAEDVDLVKKACLAGDDYSAKLEAGGKVSIINLFGKGELSVDRNSKTITEVQSADKPKEFSEIRACIKDYLLNDSQKHATQMKPEPKLVVPAVYPHKPAIEPHPNVSLMHTKHESGDQFFEGAHVNAKNVIGKINGKGDVNIGQ
jgi:hypothetical protein